MSALPASTLPALGDGPDALLAELAAAVPHFPEQAPREHRLHLFGLLAGLTGRRKRVERTGAPAGSAVHLIEMFRP